MRNMKIWFTVVLALLTIQLSADEKRYEVKSGIIEYEIQNSGIMMGMETHETGSAVTVFKEWGAVELHSQQSENVTMGQKTLNREMTKVENGKVFVVDFEQKVIYEYTPAMLANAKHNELTKSGKEMLESMGGKKTGQEKFMGYECEVWEMMHMRLWLHKGIMLKSEGNIMGIRNSITATKIKLDTPVSQSDLKLPDYPIKKATDPMFPQEGDHENQIPQMTPEQIQQMQEMMKNFSQK